MTISPVVRSVLRTAGITFAGAFLSALSITKMPHSWSDLWADVAPAMFAALIAEVAYLRSVFAVKPDAVQASASKLQSRGFVSIRVALALTIGACAIVVGAAAVQGCDWFNKSQPAIVHDVTTDGECVLTQVLAGDVDPVAIGGVCGGLAVTQVEQIVDSLFAYYVQGNTDAGLGAGEPPFRGAPTSIDDAGKAKLSAFVQKLAGGRR